MAAARFSHDDIERIIGKLTVAWTRLQLMVFFTFWRLLKSNYGQAKAIFFALRNDRDQREITSRLAVDVLHSQPELRDQIVTTLTKIGKLSGRRNDWVHAMWMEDSANAALAKVFEPSSPRLGSKDLAREAKDLYTETITYTLTMAKIADQTADALKTPRLQQKTLAEILSETLEEDPPPQLEPTESQVLENPQSDREGT